MRSYYPGDTVVLEVTVRDSDDVLFDPDLLTLNIYRGTSVFFTAYTEKSAATYDMEYIGYDDYDYTYDAEYYLFTTSNMLKLSTGEYRANIYIPTFITPGIFTAKWVWEEDGVEQVFIERFVILDRPPTPSTIQDAPRRYGIIRESAQWRTMGIGLTDRVFLIGHADGLPLNDPQQVRDMRETINLMNGDPDSPLLRALLECYNGGCRDIWVVAAAPMSEYVEYDPTDIETRFTANDLWGGLNFYERYALRLETTYEILSEYDKPEIIAPIEAPFYDTRGVDFLTPLVNHCANQFTITGSPAIGVIGTRYAEPDIADVEAMASDSRLTAIDAEGKFTMIAAGEGIYRLPQMPVSYTAPVQTSVVAALATAPIDKGVTFARLKNVLNIIGRNWKDEEVALLTNAGVNPAIRTQRGKRGEAYQSVLATDNVLGYTGQVGSSIFFSVVQIRLVSKVIAQVKALSNRRIGTIGFPILKQEIGDYLNSLSRSGVIRGHTFNMVRDPVDKNKALVDISLRPYYGLREISFTVEVGPGA